MKTFGPLYVHTLQYYHKHLLPVVEVGRTQETTRPYRQGRCLVFRLPKTQTGYVLGVWVKRPVHPDDEEAVDNLFASALRLSGRQFDTEEIGEW